MQFFNHEGYIGQLKRICNHIIKVFLELEVLNLHF